MMDIGNNNELRDAFLKDRTWENFEKYAMSELYPPIADYANFAKLVQENIDLVNTNMIFIAAYESCGWTEDDSFWREKLQELTRSENMDERAIAYYVYAGYFRNKKEIIDNLTESVKCSKHIHFVNNRWLLAMYLNNEMSEKLYLDAHNNVVNITYDDDKDEIDLSSQNWLNRMILGNDLSKDMFELKFGSDGQKQNQIMTFNECYQKYGAYY